MARTFTFKIINLFFSIAMLLIAACSSSSDGGGGGNPSEAGGSIQFTDNAANSGGTLNYDYGYQLVIPEGFGVGEFTFELWIKPDNSYPFGPTYSGSGQLLNWTSEPVDPKPSDGGGWWYKGNFLLDGHANAGAGYGTFSLQLYASGRMRWHFVDEGGYWGIQGADVMTAPSVVDGNWHQVTVVRRWSGMTDADLELWIDGILIGSAITSARTNMRNYWDGWAGFATNQEGWFWGTEKQAAIDVLSQYEDYKGLIDEIRFWNRAKTATEIMNNYNAPVIGNETGLVGLFRFAEEIGTTSCNVINATAIADNDCIALINMKPGYWSQESAPLAP